MRPRQTRLSSIPGSGVLGRAWAPPLLLAWAPPLLLAWAPPFLPAWALPILLAGSLLGCSAEPPRSAEDTVLTCEGRTAGNIARVCLELREAVAWCEAQGVGAPPEGLEPLLDCEPPTRSLCEYECVASAFYTWTCYDPTMEELASRRGRPGPCAEECLDRCLRWGYCDEPGYCGDLCTETESGKSP